MIWSAALPGAASHMPRTAAGRHALHVALLLAGLSGKPGPRGKPGLPAVSVLPASSGRPDLQPLPDLPGPLGSAALPALPVPPGEHAGPPGAPGLPPLPGQWAPPGHLPGLPPLPGQWAPPGHPLPATVMAAPQPEGTAARGAVLPKRITALGAGGQGSGPYATRAHHVRPAGHPGRPSHSRHPRPASPSTYPGPAPAGHPSDGRPEGVLGNRVMADSGSSRHGDAHAVTPGRRASLRLVPGAVARTHVAGAMGGQRDSPLFPG
ncbi:hypothetical protein [Streptomyces sp. NPDC092370]|uniref:hypothetical protein n=1 Tax=Streptomyces sp. NPDC092370 TaxID=3366016 RepID=UPI00381CFF8F